ncbi:hypothetical protein, partial [Achromobacter ruhlandii]|uniref:hypothetical protein n=1 Tax=Achromobacter ruhlandii TaxID=72557 RepID=UPI001B8B3D75
MSGPLEQALAPPGGVAPVPRRPPTLAPSLVHAPAPPPPPAPPSPRAARPPAPPPRPPPAPPPPAPAYPPARTRPT